MADDAETRRHILQLFRHVLAQEREIAIAVRARIHGRMQYALFARQIGRQRLALGLLAWRHVDRCLRFGHRLFGLQVLELEVQLFDLLVELLGAPAELHAPQLGQHQLQMLDLGCTRR